MCSTGAQQVESLYYPYQSPEESQAGERTSRVYKDPAPADEVMMEQLEFLLLHVRKGRHLGCPECARLDRIGSVLLAPFL
jgi:hypothetical protein